MHICILAFIYFINKNNKITIIIYYYNYKLDINNLFNYCK